MYRSHCAAGVFGKAAHLAMLGVGILVLGPIALGLGAAVLGVVVAVVGAVLPFVAIGAIAYGPFLLVRRMLGYSPQRTALEVRRVIPEVRRVHTVPVELAVERPESTPPARRRRGVVARMVGEVLCGGLLGGVLGAVAVMGTMGDWQTSVLLDYSALGAGIGAVVGFVVGGPRPTPVEKTPAIG
jgi:hypothetical protein